MSEKKVVSRCFLYGESSEEGGERRRERKGEKGSKEERNKRRERRDIEEGERESTARNCVFRKYYYPTLPRFYFTKAVRKTALPSFHAEAVNVNAAVLLAVHAPMEERKY